MRIIRDGDDPLFFYGCEFSLSVDEITISLFSFASHSSTELMQLCESEVFWIDDDDRIGSQEIHSILDNSRCEQDIVFSFLEGMNALFDGVSWHLSMSDHHFEFSTSHVPTLSESAIHILLDGLRTFYYESYFFLHLFHTSNSIVYDDDLTTTFQFIVDRMSNSRLDPRSDDGFDGFFLLRRSSEE